MINPELLKEVVHYLITDRQAINKFKGRLNKEFFEATPALEHVVSLVHDHHSETKSLMSAGELIRALDELCVKNKQVANIIDEPVDLVNDIMNHGNYESESLAKTIVKEVEASKILAATTKIVDNLSNNKPVTAELLLEIYNKINAEVKDLEFSYSQNELDVDFDDLLDSFENSKDQGNIIPIGMPILDSHQLGLTRNGEIGIIVAPPNRGKTAILLSLTRNMVYLGYNVLFITGETHVEDLKKRFWSGVLNTSINTLGSADREQSRKCYTGIKRCGGSLQWHSFIDQSSFTPSDLDFVVSKYRDQIGRPLDVIVLDYFDLMLPDKSSDKDSLRLQINKIYKSVRRMSAKYGIPIWTASQTNREGDDTVLITNKNIGEDWQKICNADKIISFNQTPFEVENKVARLFVLKTRNSTGKNMAVQIRTNFEMMKFKEIKELTFKEHKKLMAALEQENRKSNKDEYKNRGPKRKTLYDK